MASKLKIIFVIRSTTFFNRYQSIIKALAERGHDVLAIFERAEERWTKGTYIKPIENFQSKVKNFRYIWALQRCDSWTVILYPVRRILSYRRFLKVRQSNFFRDRYVVYLPWWLRTLLVIPGLKFLVNHALKSDLTGKFLRKLENTIPADPAIKRQIEELKPDVLIDSYGDLSMVSADLEYLKAAVALNIPSVVPVMSWDTLTTKGVMHILPDLLLAWNNIQAEEAFIDHDFNESRIKITGAPFFDDWFSNLKPSLSREKFCLKYGLRSMDPIILYLGSSAATTAGKGELWLLELLRRALDQSDNEKMRRAQIIIRPHPMNYKMYQKSQLLNTVVIPAQGALPDTPESLQLFYDTIYHSFCVTGVYSSGMICAIIVDKPVVVMKLEEYNITQAQVTHVKNLLQSGAVAIAHNIDEFLVEAGKILLGRDEHITDRPEFIKKFIRPRGLGKSAGEICADEIENLAIQKLTKK